MAKELGQRAKDLRAVAGALLASNMAVKAAKGPELVHDLADLVVDLAERVDSLTPYLDEQGGDDV